LIKGNFSIFPEPILTYPSVYGALHSELFTKSF